MELPPTSAFERPDPLQACLRPAAIWLGLASFFAGAIVLGGTLATESGVTEAFTGPILLALGVALVGGGFTMDASDLWFDPDIEFEGTRRYFVAGISAVFLALSAVVMVLAVV